MKIRNVFKYKGVFFIMSLCVIIGCATPKAVRELSNNTGANVAFVSAQLEDFAQSRGRLCQQRADKISYLEREVSEALNNLEAKKMAIEMGGDNDKKNILKELQTANNKLLALHDAAVKQEITSRKNILSGQQKLKAPSKELDAIAKNLANLAEEEDFKERIKFYVSFFRDVKDEVDKLKEEEKKANEKIKAEEENKSAKEAQKKKSEKEKEKGNIDKQKEEEKKKKEKENK